MLNPEHALIPFDVSDLPSGPWLVFAPHADDETFGMGGSLLKAKDQSIETHVVVMTDGALGGQAVNLVATRQREVDQAATLLGLSGLHFWLQPDRGLEPGKGLVDRALALIQELSAAAVFFPGPLEIHPDHRAAALITWQALQQCRSADFHPRIFSYEIGTQSPVNYLVDITAVRATHEKVMAVYDSQNSENNYLELVRALNKGRTFSLDASIEYAEGFYEFALEDLQYTLQEMTHRLIDKYF